MAGSVVGFEVGQEEARVMVEGAEVGGPGEGRLGAVRLKQGAGELAQGEGGGQDEEREEGPLGEPPTTHSE